MEHRQNEGVDTRLGMQTIDKDKIIRFPRGLMGLEEKRNFTLLRIREESPFLLLQCLDDPNLGLLVTDPYSFLDDYTVRVGDAEQQLLGVENVQQLAVLVTVSIPKGKPELTTLNLTGPILINHEAHVGLQVPQSATGLPAQVYLYKEHNTAAQQD